MNGKTTHDEVSHAVDFSTGALGKPREEKSAASKQQGALFTDSIEKEDLTHEEQRMLRMVKNISRDFFAANIYDGLKANLVHGRLGLEKIDTASLPKNEKLVESQMSVGKVAA